MIYALFVIDNVRSVTIFTFDSNRLIEDVKMGEYITTNGVHGGVVITIYNMVCQSPVISDF